MTARISPVLRCVVLALSLCLGLLLSATAAAETPTLRKLARASGLTNLSVTSLVQDDAHRLWVGTENGLHIHDGDQVTLAAQPLPGGPHSQITALARDAAGRVWIGTRGALLLARSGVATVQPVANHTVQTGSALAPAPDGALWFVGARGLYRVRDLGAAVDVEQVPAPSELGELLSIVSDGAQGFWLGCGTGLCQLQAGRWTRLGPSDGVPPGRWVGLLQHSDGSLWARSDDAVIRRDAGAARFHRLDLPGHAPHSVRAFQPIAQDPAGRVLIVRDEQLLRWDGQRWQELGSRQGLEPGANVQALVFDAAGNLWLGSGGHGLTHWAGYAHWRNWSKRDGLPSNTIWSFADDTRGGVWVGTDVGLARLDPASDKVILEPATGQQVSHLLQSPSGDLWATTFGGELLRRQGGTWQRISASMPMPLGLHVQPDGELMVASEGGLYRLRGASGAKPVPEPVAAVAALPERDRGVNRLCNGPDGTWLATWSGLRLLDAAGTLQPTAVRGLPPGSVSTMQCTAEGPQWLYMMDNSLWRLRRAPSDGWIAERETDRLLERRTIVSMLLDRSGWLWVGTGDGLLVRTENGWRRLGEADGLVWSDLDGDALHQDRLGRIWVGTSNGVSLVSSPEKLLAFEPLQLSIEALHRGTASWAAPQEIELPWSQEPLRVDWHVRTLEGRESARVKYRLGDQGSWERATHSGLRFEVLPVGRHHLQAYAENEDRGQRSAPVAVTIHVLPPWWRSTQMQIAAVLLLALAVWAAIQGRLKLMLRRQRELEEQVRLRTQDLEASHEAMRQLALTDPLTGAMNRRAILDAAERELERVRRGEGRLCLALVDIDHFKRINDTWGHPSGDGVLCETVRRLRADSRPYDLLGRYGGEEFLLLLPGAGGLAQLDRLHQAVSNRSFELGEKAAHTVTCSIGAAQAVPGQVPSLAALIESADQALYRAKHAGRNRVMLADDLPPSLPEPPPRIEQPAQA